LVLPAQRLLEHLHAITKVIPHELERGSSFVSRIKLNSVSAIDPKVGATDFQ